MKTGCRIDLVICFLKKWENNLKTNFGNLNDDFDEFGCDFKVLRSISALNYVMLSNGQMCCACVCVCVCVCV